MERRQKKDSRIIAVAGAFDIPVGEQTLRAVSQDDTESVSWSQVGLHGSWLHCTLLQFRPPETPRGGPFCSHVELTQTAVLRRSPHGGVWYEGAAAGLGGEKPEPAGAARHSWGFRSCRHTCRPPGGCWHPGIELRAQHPSSMHDSIDSCRHRGRLSEGGRDCFKRQLARRRRISQVYPTPTTRTLTVPAL